MKSGECQKQKRIRQKSDRTRQKNKRGDIEKWDQTGSPELPDRGETSETPRLPFGGTHAHRNTHAHTHIYIYIYIHTYITLHTYIYTYIHTYMCEHTLTAQPLSCRLHYTL